MHSNYDKIQEMLKEYKEQLPEPNPECPQEIQRAVPCIHEHLYQPKLTIGWLKDRCRISGAYFSTQFKHCMGKGPKAYIQHRRIEAAKRVLADKSLQQVSILELGLCLGYSGKGGFTHAFKKREGLPPGVWRRQQLG